MTDIKCEYYSLLKAIFNDLTKCENDMTMREEIIEGEYENILLKENENEEGNDMRENYYVWKYWRGKIVIISIIILVIILFNAILLWPMRKLCQMT